MRTPTFEQRWQWAAAEVADHTFLVVDGPGAAVATFTYGEMDTLAAEVANGLAHRGVRPGSAVHLVLSNSVAFVAVWLACSRLGAWMVPSDPRAARAELAGHVARTAPVVGVTSVARAGDYRAAVDRAGADTDVAVVDEADAAVPALRRVDGPPVDRRDLATVDPSERLAVMFTSGTTAAPKGVELTQANYAFAGDVMAGAAGLTRHDRQFVVLPLFHANAQYYSVASAISVGASVALAHAFSASDFVEQARRLEVTHASLFAAPIRMILARTAAGTAPLHLRNAWFAQNLSTEQYAAIAALLGCRPRQIYGMTETLPAVVSNPPVGGVPTSIGVPTLGCHVRLVDREGRAPAPGGPGAIHVGGHPGRTVFAGYLDDPATTEATVVERRDDGFVWFDTGDRAVVDEDGFLAFHGRSSDVLKVAGENVSVVEVEHALAEHPAVADVAVVGVPDPVRDEVPEAWVVLREGRASADLAEVERWAAEVLSPAKRPRAYHAVDELPRTSVGKIRKFLLGSGQGSVGGDGEVPEMDNRQDEEVRR